MISKIEWKVLKYSTIDGKGLYHATGRDVQRTVGPTATLLSAIDDSTKPLDTCYVSGYNMFA